jgi:hypothetical protein
VQGRLKPAIAGYSVLHPTGMPYELARRLPRNYMWALNHVCAKATLQYGGEAHQDANTEYKVFERQETVPDRWVRRAPYDEVISCEFERVMQRLKR